MKGKSQLSNPASDAEIPPQSEGLVAQILSENDIFNAFAQSAEHFREYIGKELCIDNFDDFREEAIAVLGQDFIKLEYIEYKGDFHIDFDEFLDDFEFWMRNPDEELAEERR